MTGRWKPLLVGFLLLSGCKKSTPPPADTGPLPTQVLENFEMQDLQNGVRSMLLRAAQGRLFEGQNVAELDLPVAVFYSSGVATSEMKAPSGKIYTLTHEIEAWSGVTVVTQDSATLTTERLRYDPKLRLIISTSPVRIDKPDSVTEGEGLQADPELTHVRIGKQKVRMKKSNAR